MLSPEPTRMGSVVACPGQRLLWNPGSSSRSSHDPRPLAIRMVSPQAPSDPLLTAPAPRWLLKTLTRLVLTESGLSSSHCGLLPTRSLGCQVCEEPRTSCSLPSLSKAVPPSEGPSCSACELPRAPSSRKQPCPVSA